MNRTLELRYYVMLALYFPILLYAVSTFDVSEDTYAVKDYQAISVADTTVVLGQPFEAQAFLAVQSLAANGGEPGETVRPQLVPGEGLSRSGESALQMETAELLASGESERRVSYGAHFKVEQLGGTVQEFPVSGEFTVRRPEIVATSEVTRVLYRHSLNRVRLSVPGLENRPLRIETPAGSTTEQTVALSPSGGRVETRVYLQRADGDDVLLGSKSFEVVDPPRPSIRIFSAQGEVTSGDRLDKRRAMLRFEINPDQQFQARFPQDATYEATEATVFLRRGLTATQRLGVYDIGDEGRLVLTSDLRGAEAGDQIIVRIDQVVRVNHRGRRIEVPLDTNTRTFGFTLS